MKAQERHEIKTDKFLMGVARVQEFIIDNARVVGWTFLIIVAAVIVYLGVNWYIDTREDSASDALSPIVADFLSEQANPEFNDKEMSDIRKELETFLEDHSGTSAASFANYYLGIITFDSGEADAAIVKLNQVIDSGNVEAASLAASYVGEYYLREKKYNDAAALFEKFANKTTTKISTAYFAYKAGYSYELSGEKDKALELYNKAKNSESLPLNSMILQKVERRIAGLNK